MRSRKHNSVQAMNRSLSRMFSPANARLRILAVPGSSKSPAASERAEAARRKFAPSSLAVSAYGLATQSLPLALLHAASDATRMDHPAGKETPLHSALRMLRHVCRPGTLAFVISDFADHDARVETELRRLSQRAHVTMISVHDPLDARLPPQGGRLSDGAAVLAIERMRRADLDTHARAFARRQAALQALARKTGMVWHGVATTDDPKTLLRPNRMGAPFGVPHRRAA